MMNSQKYPGKTVLCIDYGTKNIGFSLFKIDIDPFPMPFYQIKNKSSQDSIRSIVQLIGDECVDLVVLGLPYIKTEMIAK